MALVEPRPRASETIMNYSSEFVTEEAVSWLQSHGMRLKKGKKKTVAMAKISLPSPKMQTYQESSPSSKTVQTSIDDSDNISDYENLEVTLAPKEKGKSPKDLCFTDEATELSTV